MRPGDLSHPVPCTEQVPARPGCSRLQLNSKTQLQDEDTTSPLDDSFNRLYRDFKKLVLNCNFPHCNLCPFSLSCHGMVNTVSCYLFHPTINSLFPGDQLLDSGSVSCCRIGGHVPFLLWQGLSIQTWLLHQLSCRDASKLLSHSRVGWNPRNSHLFTGQWIHPCL